MILRSLAAGCVAAAALTTLPAAAMAETTYDVRAYTQIVGTAGGSDGGGWSSNSSWGTEVEQVIVDIPADADDRHVYAKAPGNHVAATRLQQDYVLETAMGPLAWNCTKSAEAIAPAGDFAMTRAGDVWHASVTVATSVRQPRSCTGFSSLQDEITITPAPATYEFEVAHADLLRGPVTRKIDVSLPCGEWTIYQVGCAAALLGSVQITRFGAELDPEEEPQEPEAEPTPVPTPWDGDPDVSSPPRPATPIQQVRGKLTKNGKAVKVKVDCSSACSGKVSATAVAKRRQAAKPVGSKSYTSTGGTKAVKVEFIKGGARSVRKRGGLIINVTAGAQKASQRISIR